MPTHTHVLILQRNVKKIFTTPTKKINYYNGGKYENIPEYKRSKILQMTKFNFDHAEEKFQPHDDKWWAIKYWNYRNYHKFKKASIKLMRSQFPGKKKLYMHNKI